MSIGRRKRKAFKPDNQEDSAFVHFAAKIEFLPKKAIMRAKILARFEQNMDFFGFNVMNPTIMLHNIVPDDSEIFSAIKSGDLHQLVALLKDGKASLRDCDADGRSLLSVSTLRSFHTPELILYRIPAGTQNQIYADS
jgi:hypothetical protein